MCLMSDLMCRVLNWRTACPSHCLLAITAVHVSKLVSPGCWLMSMHSGGPRIHFIWHVELVALRSNPADSEFCLAVQPGCPLVGQVPDPPVDAQFLRRVIDFPDQVFRFGSARGLDDQF